MSQIVDFKLCIPIYANFGGITTPEKRTKIEAREITELLGLKKTNAYAFWDTQTVY